jgi:hypothetical protein
VTNVPKLSPAKSLRRVSGKFSKPVTTFIARLQLACGEPAGEGAAGRLQLDRHDASEGCRRRARHRPSETVSVRGLRQREDQERDPAKKTVEWLRPWGKP